jgi:hypothetical protein
LVDVVERNELEVKIEAHVLLEEKSIHDLYSRRKVKGEEYYQRVAPQKHNEKYCRFQTARIFLNQMGFFSFDNLKDGRLILLNKSSSLNRDIKGLDRKFSRELIKLAVIYVGQSQNEESVLLRNDSGSKIYEEFVSSLGWLVDLNSHGGYKGGLDSNMMVDGLATYFCTSTLEIIFHDVTKMITDPTDNRQLKKKRHIGLIFIFSNT